MQLILKDATIFSKGKLTKKDMTYCAGQWVAFSDFPIAKSSDISHSILSGVFLFPGLVDVHVHLREPGFSYKETIKTGTQAAAAGGYTAVMSMPNLSPAPDCVANVQTQLDIIKKDALVHVYPYGCITMGQMGKGELCDYESLRPLTIGFSDDGRGVQSDDTMASAMQAVAKVGGMIVAHCEDNSLLHGGCIHDGAFAKAHGYAGICSESEWRQVERDLALVKETGCRYHVCHVSTKESVALIRKAKQEGLDVTCETAPHYLLLCDEDLQEHGRFKMNPPIRTASDRDALIEGLLDGTVDIIATDHAPHSADEKNRGLDKSAMGVVGLECAFSVLYTGLVKTGKVPLECILKAMCDTPRMRFGLPPVDVLDPNADTMIFNPNIQTTVSPDTFLSKGRATPFDGMPICGQCEYTFLGGQAVWQRK